MLCSHLPLGSVGLVYLPSLTIKINHSCRFNIPFPWILWVRSHLARWFGLGGFWPNTPDVVLRSPLLFALSDTPQKINGWNLRIRAPLEKENSDFQTIIFSFYCGWFRNPIPNHLGCVKQICESWDKTTVPSTGFHAGFLNRQQYLTSWKINMEPENDRFGRWFSFSIGWF